MAMEKLGQLRAEDRWDLIVVDTPPSRSARRIPRPSAL
jgi:anion-transporting  ArsA/GET3 family ATPase